MPFRYEQKRIHFPQDIPLDLIPARETTKTIITRNLRDFNLCYDLPDDQPPVTDIGMLEVRDLPGDLASCNLAIVAPREILEDLSAYYTSRFKTMHRQDPGVIYLLPSLDSRALGHLFTINFDTQAVIDVFLAFNLVNYSGIGYPSAIFDINDQLLDPKLAESYIGDDSYEPAALAVILWGCLALHKKQHFPVTAINIFPREYNPLT